MPKFSLQRVLFSGHLIVKTQQHAHANYIFCHDRAGECQELGDSRFSPNILQIVCFSTGCYIVRLAKKHFSTRKKNINIP